MKFLGLLTILVCVMGCSKSIEQAKETSTAAAKISDRGLSVGASAPQIVSLDIEGKLFELKKAVLKGPVVLVFYRGGWCPYCSLQLRNLQAKALPQVAKAGGQLVAISVDTVDSALKTKNKDNLEMIILSDSKAETLKAFDVDYKVPEELVAKYKNKYKLDLEAASGQKHHIIAVPAVYVVDKKGKITFAYVNEDYKVRAQVEDIVRAVQAL